MPNNFVSAPQPLAFKDTTANLFKNPIDSFKATTKTTTAAPKKAAVSSYKTPLPDDTKLYQDLNVKTGVGGYGEGQTADTLSQGLNVRAYRPELINQMYDAKSEEQGMVNSSFTTSKANELDSSLFTATKGLSLESTLGDVKLAKYNAQKNISDFANPNSTISKTFKSNIGEEKYNYYTDFVNGAENYVNALRSDKTLANDTHPYTRTLYNTDLLRWVTNKATGGEMEKYNAAADYLSNRGEVENTVTDKVLKVGGTLTGDLPKYMALGAVGDFAATEGLISAGYTIGGETGYNMIKLGNSVRQVAQTSPYLYNATINSGLTTALDYGTQKLMGRDYSGSDVAQSLLMGAAIPSILKLGGDLIGKIKIPLTTKDVQGISKALDNEVNVNGATSLQDAFENIADTHIIGDGKTTVRELINNYKENTKVNPDAILSHEEVISGMANNGVSVSKKAGKRLATTITELNKKVGGEESAGGGYGEMGKGDAIQMFKSDLINEFHNSPVVNDSAAQAAIEKVAKTHGVEIPSIVKEHNTIDEVDDMFHSPDFNPKEFNTAESFADLSKSIEGEKAKVVSIKDIDTAHTSIDITNKAGAKSVQELADKAGIPFDWNKAAIDGVAQNDYLHNVLDQIESHTYGFSKFSKRIANDWMEASTAMRKNLKGASKLDATFSTKDVGGEAVGNISTLQRDFKTLQGRLTTAASQKEKDAIAALMEKKNAQIANLKAKTSARNADLKALKGLIKNEIDTGSTKYYTMSSQGKFAIKNKYKAQIANATTLDDATRIVNNFHKEMYSKNVRLISSKVDKQISTVKRLATSKTKKNPIDLGSAMQMVETYKDFNKARLEGDLFKMEDVSSKLKTFEQEGRSIYQENVERVKGGVVSTVNDGIARIPEGKTRYEFTSADTAHGDIHGRKTPIARNIYDAVVDGTPPIHIIGGIFGKDSALYETFYGNFVRGFSKEKLKQVQILDKIIPNGLDALEKEGAIFKNKQELNFKWNIWRTLQEEYDGKMDRVVGQPLLFQKMKSGDWRFISEVDNGRLSKPHYAESIAKGDVVYLPDMERSEAESFIAKFVSDIDAVYAKRGAFYTNENELRQVTDEIGSLTKTHQNTIFNKPFEPINKYHPQVVKRNGKSGETVDANGNVIMNMKESVLDGHTKDRVKQIGADYETELDINKVFHHYVTNQVHYAYTIDSQIKADKALYYIRQGKNYVSKIGEDDPIHLDDIGTKAPEVLDAAVGENEIVSKEVANYMSRYLDMVRTNGASIRDNSNLTRLATMVNKIGANSLLRGNLGTIEKQLLSTIDTTRIYGEKNALSGIMSMGNMENFRILTDLDKGSGNLLDRLPPLISNEGRSAKYMAEKGITNKDFSSVGVTGKVKEGVVNTARTIGKGLGIANDGIDVISQNLMKFTDGFSSYHAFMTSASDYLEKTYPDYHKAGKPISLGDFAAKYGDEATQRLIQKSEEGMTRVMSSNIALDQSLASGTGLGKVVAFMGKSSINRAATQYFDVKSANGYLKKLGKFGGVMTYNAINYGAQVGMMYGKYMVLAGLGATAVGSFGKVYDWAGKEVKNPTAGDLAAYHAIQYLKSIGVSPGVGSSMVEGLSGVTKQITAMSNAPTTNRKIEEGVYAVGRLAVHSDPIDFLRFVAGTTKNMVDGTTAETPSDTPFTKEFNKTYDTSTKSVVSQYGDKFNSLTPEKQKELIDFNTQVSKANKPIAEKKAQEKKARDEYIQGAVKKYGANITAKEYNEYATANMDTYKSLGLATASQKKSLLTSMQLSSAKTSGESDSILMGKDLEVVFDVKIKPLLEDGKKEEAFTEMKRLRKIGVIKSSSGSHTMVKLYNEFKPQ